jgi:glucokinase
MNMKALAVDLGGSHGTCGVVEDSRLLAHEILDANGAKSLRAVLPEIIKSSRKLLAQMNLTADDCAGLAMGLPAIVDARTGRVLSTRTKYEDANDVDLTSWCRTELNLSFRLENDARMALLGECYGGAAAGFSDVVMMTLGTGIGGTTMIEGKLLRGKHSQAGCLGGHLPVLFTGRACICGAIGCAEAEAAGWSLPIVAREWKGMASSVLAGRDPLNFQQLFGAADEGDAIACEIRDRCLEIWGVAALSLVHAYDPEILVVGGGVMQSAHAILPAIQKYLDEHAWTDWGKVQVKAAKLGNNAALLGAIPLLIENF